MLMRFTVSSTAMGLPFSVEHYAEIRFGHNVGSATSIYFLMFMLIIFVPDRDHSSKDTAQ